MENWHKLALASNRDWRSGRQASRACQLQSGHHDYFIQYE
jgi:hypothetical protein